MPSLQEHCNASKKRTGYKFITLHKWIDQNSKSMGNNHRAFRHSLQDNDKEYIKKRWGDLGVIEWIHHIVMDYQETEDKLLRKYFNNKTFK